jgi:hypothetical protein
MKFEIVGEFGAIEAIATGSGIRALAAIRRKWGPGRWRKMKGIVLVRLKSGSIREAEIHWTKPTALAGEISRSRDC